MTALIQFSYTSAKNWRIASSACGLVGLCAMELVAWRFVEEAPAEVDDRVEFDFGVDDEPGRPEEDVPGRLVGSVIRLFGPWERGKRCAVDGEVGSGLWRRRNLARAPVWKREMWLL